MQLFWFECRLILRHKLYILYILSFLLLFYITVHPFSLGKNFAPMDECHLLIHMLLEDSEKDEIENEYLTEKLEKLAAAYAYAFHTEDDREDLKKKIAFIEEHGNLVLSAGQKSFLDGKVKEVVKKIDNGAYHKEELLQMDTAEFQKLELGMSDRDVDQLLDEVNEKLGGWTHFAAYGLDEGESFRRTCAETRTYHGDLFHEYEKNGHSRLLSADEALAKYDREAVQTGYTGMFMPYVSDKLGLILSLTTAFIIAIFQTAHQGCTKDIIAVRAGTAAAYMGIKGASMVFMGWIACLASVLLLDLRLCKQGVSFGYHVDPYVMLAGTTGILLPELIFLILSGMLAVVVLDSAVAPFLLEVVFFGISVDDFYGSYGWNRIVIRFPLLANSGLFAAFQKELVRNRLYVCLFAAGIFGMLVLAYHMQKYGKAFWGIYWLQRQKENFRLWKRQKEAGLERKRVRRKEESDFSGSSVLYYLFLLGYWKGVICCAVLDLVSSWIFRGDMSNEQICMRFLPLHAVVLFSVIGFAQEEGNCSDLLVIKNQIHMGLMQFLCSGVLTLLSVYGSARVLFACEKETTVLVLLFSMILGGLYTAVKQKFGVVMGTFAAAGAYMLAAVSVL